MIHSGGRAGPHEFGWIVADYELDQIEQKRQELLAYNDIGKIQRFVRKVGIFVERALLDLVKRYIFDSPGIGFLYKNYRAWRNLAIGQGLIGDASFLAHEIGEVEELQRTQSRVGFDFMGTKYDNLSYKRQKQWESDFNRYYREAHSKALEREYEFIASQVNRYINEPKLKVSKLQSAAIDPTRYRSPIVEETETSWYMFVGGVPMREHHDFNAWSKRADEPIPLSKAIQRRLGYYRPQITLKNLIVVVKNKPIN